MSTGEFCAKAFKQIVRKSRVNFFKFYFQKLVFQKVGANLNFFRKIKTKKAFKRLMTNEIMVKEKPNKFLLGF